VYYFAKYEIIILLSKAYISVDVEIYSLNK